MVLGDVDYEVWGVGVMVPGVSGGRLDLGVGVVVMCGGWMVSVFL